MVSISAIRNFEQGKTTLQTQNMRAVVRAFEEAGVELLPEDEKGEGARFKEPQS